MLDSLRLVLVTYLATCNGARGPHLEVRFCTETLLGHDRHRFTKGILCRNAVAVIVKVTYGYQIGGNDDPIVRILEEAFQISVSLSTPGKYWVEFMPFCTSFPL